MSALNFKRVAVVTVLVTILAAATGLWWLSRNLDGLAKDAIQNYGTAMAKAEVRVGEVQLSPSSGLGRIRKLTIANPQGFKTAHALEVSKIEVELDVTTLAKDVIVIRRVDIESPDVIYEKGESITNFDALMRNIALYTGASSSTAAGNGSKKLIIDSLLIHDVKAHASAALLKGKTVDIALPDIALKNIGQAQGGVTPGELGGIVANALRARLAASFSFERLVHAGGNLLQKAGATIKGWFSK